MSENSSSANLEEKVGAQFSCDRWYKSVFVSEDSLRLFALNPWITCLVIVLLVCIVFH